jgi:hypothetical protein
MNAGQDRRSWDDRRIPAGMPSRRTVDDVNVQQRYRLQKNTVIDQLGAENIQSDDISAGR